MKTMTCRQLGGPESCDYEFKAETFEEIAELSKKHAHEMYRKSDKAHIEAMQKMMEKMKDPKAMKKWMDKKRKEFEA